MSRVWKGKTLVSLQDTKDIERSCLCENSSDSCFRPAESVGDVQCCYIKSTCLELAPSPREDKTPYTASFTDGHGRSKTPQQVGFSKEQSETFVKKLKQHRKNAINSKGRFDDSWSEGVHSDLQRAARLWGYLQESRRVLPSAHPKWLSYLQYEHVCFSAYVCVHHCIISI